MARDNVEVAQQWQKENYDQKAKERDLQVGDKVLVLFPTSGNKLFTEWQGPFEIIWRAGPIDYEVHCPGHAREHQIYHVNLLKAQRELEGWMVSSKGIKEEFGPEICEDSGEEKLDELIQQGERLTEKQQRDLKIVIYSFKHVFNERPGWAKGIRHEIQMPKGAIVHECWCTVPHHLQQTLYKELGKMLEQGIVVPSCSPWQSPMVIVPKADGSLRICMDFR